MYKVTSRVKYPKNNPNLVKDKIDTQSWWGIFCLFVFFCATTQRYTVETFSLLFALHFATVVVNSTGQEVAAFIL